jgi:hypothetical protein
VQPYRPFLPLPLSLPMLLQRGEPAPSADTAARQIDLKRMPTVEIADKRRLFELFTALKVRVACCYTAPPPCLRLCRRRPVTCDGCPCPCILFFLSCSGCG